MKRIFIKIQEKRYRLSIIKKYEPCYYSHTENKYGLIIWFSAMKNVDRTTHMFETKKERDKLLILLDNTFNCQL